MRASLGDVVSLWCRVPEYQWDAGACGTRYCCYERVIQIRCRQAPPGDAVASEGASAMDVVIERCAGIDIGKKMMAVTIRTPGQGQGRRRQQTRTFGTVTSQVLALRDWLVSEAVQVAAMEATSDYVRREGAWVK
jgi:hypothetical protein